MLSDKKTLTARAIPSVSISVTAEMGVDGLPVVRARYALAIEYDNGRVLRWHGPAGDLVDAADVKGLLMLAEAVYAELTTSVERFDG